MRTETAGLVPGSEAAVGTVRGPGESAHEYVFVTPDPDQRAMFGEFVTYDAVTDGTERRIFGRISSRAPERRYPSGFLANPGVAPDDMATMLGYDAADLRGTELDAITTTILGYYDPDLKEFINPRCPPRQGNTVHIAGDAELAAALSNKRPDEIGSARIGSLLSRRSDAVPIVLDVRAITSTHLAIIAGTGSGKSYLAAVLLEEMMRPANRAAVLVVDPHGEYGSLDQVANCPALCEEGYRPEAKIVRPGDIKVRVSSLQRGDLRYLLPEMTERMVYFLEQAVHRLQGERQRAWALDDLLAALDSGERSRDGQEDPTVGALRWRLLSTLRSATTIFDDNRDLQLRDLFAPGRCTVLQLNEVDHKEQQLVVATLLRRLYEARVKTTKQQVSEGEAHHLPFPVFVLIEEAHSFAPASGEGVATGILKQILSEGRKFGVGVGLISQRPGRLDSDVLSQCMTQFLLRIVNPLDQESVSRAVEGVGRDLLGELPALSKGQALISGRAVNTPVLCRVRSRHTRHVAEDPDAPGEWVAFQRSSAARAERAAALPPPAPRVTKDDPFEF
jgi:uncharacterized protein